MVLNEIIRGAAGIAVATEGQGLESQIRGHSATEEDLKEAVVSVMEEYISLKNWHLITVSEETDRDRQDQQVRTVSAPQPPESGFYCVTGYLKKPQLMTYQPVHGRIKGTVRYFGKYAS